MKPMHWLWLALVFVAGAMFYAWYTSMGGGSKFGPPGAVDETMGGTMMPHSILPTRQQILRVRPFYRGH